MRMDIHVEAYSRLLFSWIHCICFLTLVISPISGSTALLRWTRFCVVLHGWMEAGGLVHQQGKQTFMDCMNSKCGMCCLLLNVCYFTPESAFCKCGEILRAECARKGFKLEAISGLIYTEQEEWLIHHWSLCLAPVGKGLSGDPYNCGSLYLHIPLMTEFHAEDMCMLPQKPQWYSCRFGPAVAAHCAFPPNTVCFPAQTYIDLMPMRAFTLQGMFYLISYGNLEFTWLNFIGTPIFTVIL